MIFMYIKKSYHTGDNKLLYNEHADIISSYQLSLAQKHYYIALDHIYVHINNTVPWSPRSLSKT